MLRKIQRGGGLVKAVGGAWSATKRRLSAIRTQKILLAAFMAFRLLTRMLAAASCVFVYTAAVGYAQIRTSPPPPPPAPSIHPGDDIILYLHGGPGSRLEEASDLVAPLIAAGLALDRRFTIVAFDQPSQGYSTALDPLAVVKPHVDDFDFYSMVQFNEEFIVAFVNELDKVVPIKNRNIYIIGGSTGGMLALRMAHRSEPWIKGVVAWNPASVWTTYAYDVLKGKVLHDGFARAQDPDSAEQDGSRRDYFDQVFGSPSQFFNVQPNPEEWYRGDRDQYVSSGNTHKPFRAEWNCKWDYIASARLELQEVYSATGRRWHWRFGTEELLFSFFNDSWYGPAKTASDDSTHPNYQSIVRPLFLMASDDDDWNEGAAGVMNWPWGQDPISPLSWENRWTQTNLMMSKMRNTPGYFMAFNNTGHSIHNERPQLLAKAIAWFVSSDAPPAGPLQAPPPMLETTDEPCSSDFDPTSKYFRAPNADYPSGRFATPIRALIDSGDATHDPAVYLKERASLGGIYSDGSSPGTYGLRLRADLRAVAQAGAAKKDASVALLAAALAHYRGDDLTANALADLAVTGRVAYDAFYSATPSDASLEAALANEIGPSEVPGPQISQYESCVRAGKSAAGCQTVLPGSRNLDRDSQALACSAQVESGCRLKFPKAFVSAPPKAQLVEAAVQFAKNRALQVAWALRNPDTAQALHERSTLGWIAVSSEDDLPARPVNVPSGIPVFGPDGVTQVGSYQQYDLQVPVPPAGSRPADLCTWQGSDCGLTPVFFIRYTIASPPPALVESH